MNLDFQPPRSTSSPRQPSRIKLRYGLYLLLAILLVVPFFFRPAVTSTEAFAPAEQQAPAPPPVPEIRREILNGEVSPGDTLTGLLSVFCGIGFNPADAAVLAARANRMAGFYAKPNPATQGMAFIKKIPRALSIVAKTESGPETRR